MNEGNPDCDGCLYTGKLYESPHGYSNCHAPNGEYRLCMRHFKNHPEEYPGDYDGDDDY